MMIFKKAIPRRTFLRGVGATVALPLLDSMVPAFAATGDKAKPVQRLGFIYNPNGRIMEKWLPSINGAPTVHGKYSATTIESKIEFSPTLEPLAPFQDRLLVLSGLDIKAAFPRPGEAGGGHGRPCSAFLTGIHAKPGGAMGTSVDQLVARQLRKHTQLGSLELTLESPDILGKGDGAYSDAYTKTISWLTKMTPLPMEANPRAVFERLLGGSESTDPAVRSREIRRNRSILDSVTEEVNSLLTGFGPRDRTRLTEYLDSIRDIERRIQLAEEQVSRKLPEMERPAGMPATFSEHIKLMFDLEVLAFQGDLTRVTTMMLGPEQSDRIYREIGIADAHHQLSHHAGNVEWIEMIGKIDRLHSEMFAYYLEKLRSTPDGDGTLLDHSMIIYSSGLSSGMWHSHNDVPTLLAGGGAGRIKGGRHIRYPGLPLTNLHLTVMDIMGVPSEELTREETDATGKLEHLSI
ncbi:MAG: DUF1552 domain-containing protein [Acidobacteria bacterium]|nr:DUF1552 domain-containing protein [Acidobacteriota bacterium]